MCPQSCEESQTESGSKKCIHCDIPRVLKVPDVRKCSKGSLSIESSPPLRPLDGGIGRPIDDYISILIVKVTVGTQQSDIGLKLVHPTEDFATEHYDALKTRYCFLALANHFASGFFAIVWKERLSFKNLDDAHVRIH
ncbi:hypothetical protein PROFUN_04244 [Planoprotostelium fungivorum]|uniref:Uncharacterized protein n=1 Tax=Planoprotostelium fungivorum TaxID=1890364 RepID=A0A2P6NV16_9EUKA|nr:hypothetical protein PROFUN_04244 [Planoprotostelium fungivorum]